MTVVHLRHGGGDPLVDPGGFSRLEEPQRPVCIADASELVHACHQADVAVGGVHIVEGRLAIGDG